MSRILHNKKLRLNRRGFSSIVGAIFALIAIASLTTAMFVWSLNTNTSYNNALRVSNQADLDRTNEQALANVSATPFNSYKAVSVNGTLENVGSLVVTLNTLWVVDTTSGKFNSSTSPLNLTLKPGNTTILNGPTAITIPLTTNASDNLICWFVSTRGNVISQRSLVLATVGNATINNLYQTVNNVTTTGNFTVNGNTTVYNIGGGSTTYSNVSQGIGLIAFDFKGFSHIDLGSQPSTNNYLLSNFIKTYTLSQSHFIVMHVTLTNFDPQEQLMYINPGSAIYYVGSHSGTTKYNSWGLLNVTGSSSTGWYLNDATQNPYPASYVLPYGVPVDIFFGGVGNTGGGVDPNVYPLNIMVYGKLGTNDYGQNVPFVAAYIS